MKIRRLGLAILISLAGLYLSSVVPKQTTAQAVVGLLSDKAKTVVSKITGIPVERLIIENEANLANTGIRQFKLTDPQGNLYNISLDSAGNEVSQEMVEKAWREFDNRGFAGKLESELASRIAQGGNQPLRVIFHLKGEGGEPLQERISTNRQARLDSVKNRIALIQKPLVNDLKGLGQEIVYQSLYAPMVVVSVKPSLIKTLAERLDVERIYLERQGAVRLNTSRVIVQGDILSNRGLTGTAETVGVVEPGRIGTHPNLPAIQRTLCRPTASTTIDNHKTWVAGVIQSNDIARRGIAPNVDIVDGIMATNTDAEAMAATDCVINTASATNLSYGNDTNGVFDPLARYFDSLVYNTGASVAVAASNNCPQMVGSPEIAFNVIGVGSLDDKNTIASSDDTANCVAPMTHGAFMNPPSPNNDREEPDIVAPGNNITTTANGGGFITVSGNSFAAPHVAAGITLLRSRKSELFTFAAEVRAIMLASSRRNIEGNSRLSDRDGAGAILLAAADTIVSNGLSEYIFVDGAASNFPINRTFTASNGQRVRVAISWDHKMPLGNTMTQPTTDLDLQVFCGSTVIGTSASRDNNYEIVEFNATTCSNGYTAKIVNTRSSAGLEQIGYAVSKTDS